MELILCDHDVGSQKYHGNQVDHNVARDEPKHGAFQAGPTHIVGEDDFGREDDAWWR